MHSTCVEQVGFTVVLILFLIPGQKALASNLYDVHKLAPSRLCGQTSENNKSIRSIENKRRRFVEDIVLTNPKPFFIFTLSKG